jgi:hypothetical protein
LRVGHKEIHGTQGQEKQIRQTGKGRLLENLNFIAVLAAYVNKRAWDQVFITFRGGVNNPLIILPYDR